MKKQSKISRESASQNCQKKDQSGSVHQHAGSSNAAICKATLIHGITGSETLQVFFTAPRSRKLPLIVYLILSSMVWTAVCQDAFIKVDSNTNTPLGAMWHLHGDVRTNNLGQSVPVQAGVYTIDFDAPAGYLPPASQSLRAFAGLTFSRTAPNFQKIMTFDFESPIDVIMDTNGQASFCVQLGNSLLPASLQVTCGQPGAAVITTTAGPDGIMVAVKRNSTNLFEIPLVLKATTLQGFPKVERLSLRQFDFVPWFFSGVPAPVSALPDFSCDVTYSEAGTNTNTVVCLIGTDVIIQAGHANNLFGKINGRRLKKLVIRCNNLQILSPVTLPGCELDVATWSVNMQSTVDVSSPAWDLPTPALTNGLDGKAGPPVRFIAELAYLTNGAGILAHGGAGADGGLGQNGADGVSFDPALAALVLSKASSCPQTNWIPASRLTNGFLPPRVPGIWVSKSNLTYIEFTYGNDFGTLYVPPAGANPIPGGRPGVGGAGGIASVSSNLFSIVDVSGGQSGSKPPMVRAGKTGAPNPSLHWDVDKNNMRYVYSTLDNTNTANAPDPVTPAGAVGTVTALPFTNSFTIENARTALARAERLHSLRLYHEAYAWAISVRDVATQKLAGDSQFSVLQADAERLAALCQNQQDIFGNPAGWVPSLTAGDEAILFAIYGKHYVAMEFLAEALISGEIAASNRLAVLNATEQEARSGLSQAISRYLANQQQWEDLQAETQQAVSNRVAVTEHLRELMDRAENQAKMQEADKSKFSFLKSIFSIVSIAVPTLKPFATSADSVLSAVQNPPFQSVTTSAVDFVGATEQLGTTLRDNTLLQNSILTTGQNVVTSATAALNSTSMSDLADKTKAMNASVDALQKSFTQLSQVSQSAAAPSTASLSALAQRILTANPEYAVYQQELAAQTKSEAQIQQQAATLLQEAQQLVTEIQSSINLLAETARLRAAGLDQIDQRTVDALTSLSQVAKRRLVMAQHSLRAAYEFLTLSPWPNITEDNAALTDRVRQLLAAGKTSLTEQDRQDLLQVLLQPLYDVANDLVNVQLNSPDRLRITSRFSLTADELSTLNAGGPILINPFYRLGVVPARSEQVVISGIRVVGMTVSTNQNFGFGSVELDAGHCGTGLVWKSGKAYKFQFAQEDPLFVGSILDLASGQIQTTETSSVYRDALQGVITAMGITLTDAQLQKTPAAPADGDIELNAYADTFGAPAPLITSATVEIDLEYSRITDSSVTIAVHDLHSLPVVTTKNGVLSSTATEPYTLKAFPGDQVQIIAPQRLDDLYFDHWQTPFGTTMGTSPTLPISVSSAVSVAPIYIPVDDPIITNQPSSVTVSPGSNATFSVAALGSGLSYQWQFHGTNMPGATNSILVLTNVQVGQSGTVEVLCSNRFSTVASDLAFLGVDGPYHGLWQTIPGHILVGSYDEGGELAAYHDADAINHGSFRTNEAVDIWSDGVTPGNMTLCYTTAGEWLRYSCEVLKSDVYSIVVSSGNQDAGSTIHFELDDTDVTGKIVLPNTHSWVIYQKTRINGINMPAGRHVLKLVMDVDGGGPGNGIGQINGIDVLGDPEPAIPAITADRRSCALSWTAVQGYSYQIQFKQDLNTTNWLDLGAPVVSTNSVISICDQIGTNTQRFYRAILLP